MNSIKTSVKIGGILLLIGLVIWYVKFYGLGIDDFRIMTINEKGIVLRSISWQRKMINDLRIAPEVKIWVPRGMSWYRSDKIGKLLISQNKRNMANDVAFYNFGFIPDVVFYGNDKSRAQEGEIISKWGIINYVRYLTYSFKLMIKEEVVSSDLVKATDFLNDMVSRDLADSRLLNEDLRLTVYNQSQSNGLASFMSKILEWSGFTVVGVENLGGSVEMCQINYGAKVNGSYGLKVIKTQFPECEYLQELELGDTELELHFGDKYSQMLNYQGYDPEVTD